MSSTVGKVGSSIEDHAAIGDAIDTTGVGQPLDLRRCGTREPRGLPKSITPSVGTERTMSSTHEHCRALAGPESVTNAGASPGKASAIERC